MCALDKLSLVPFLFPCPSLPHPLGSLSVFTVALYPLRLPLRVSASLHSFPPPLPSLVLPPFFPRACSRSRLGVFAVACSAFTLDRAVVERESARGEQWSDSGSERRASQPRSAPLSFSARSRSAAVQVIHCARRLLRPVRSCEWRPASVARDFLRAREPGVSSSSASLRRASTSWSACAESRSARRTFHAGVHEKPCVSKAGPVGGSSVEVEHAQRTPSLGKGQCEKGAWW